jgi:hypothetical protein
MVDIVDIKTPSIVETKSLYKEAEIHRRLEIFPHHHQQQSAELNNQTARSSIHFSSHPAGQASL